MRSAWLYNEGITLARQAGARASKRRAAELARFGPRRGSGFRASPSASAEVLDCRA